MATYGNVPLPCGDPPTTWTCSNVFTWDPLLHGFIYLRHPLYIYLQAGGWSTTEMLCVLLCRSYLQLSHVADLAVGCKDQIIKITVSDLRTDGDKTLLFLQ